MTTAGVYLHKPIKVLAFQWCGLDHNDKVIGGPDWFNLLVSEGKVMVGKFAAYTETHRGRVYFDMGTWVVMNQVGEVTPVRPDVFEACYERDSHEDADRSTGMANLGNAG